MLTSRPGRLIALIATAAVAIGGCASARDVADAEPPASVPTSTDPTDDADDTSNKRKRKRKQQRNLSEPNVGDCHRLAAEDVIASWIDNDDTIKCSKNHNTQTVYVSSARGRVGKALKSGNEQRLFELMLPRCRKRLASWTGGGLSRISRSMFDVVIGVPSERDIERGADWVRCDVSLNGKNQSPISLPRQTKGALEQRRSEYDLCVRGDFARRGTTIVPCGDKHDYRSVASIAIGDPADDRYPGESAVRSLLERRCPTEVDQVVGSTPRYGWTYPTKRQWKNSTGFGTCYAKTKK